MNQDPADLYRIQKCIGKGTFGDVYKGVEKKTHRIVAIKVVNLDDTTEEISTLIQEINFLSQLRSPFITNYYNTFVKNNCMWIVMEHCGGGSCSDLLRHYKLLDEGIVLMIIGNCLHGLHYLHSQHKIHRDIKAANILITELGQIKLADFGVSGQLTISQAKKHTFVGTPLWMLPEVILRKEGYNEKCDIWSLGITTIELITGSPPYSDRAPMKILFDIPRMDPPVLVGPNHSRNLKKFVLSCLKKDPKTRPSLKSLLSQEFLKTSFTKESMALLIRKRNALQYGTRAAVKKPRHPLDLSKGNDIEPLVDWDFTKKFTLERDVDYENTSSPLDEKSSNQQKAPTPVSSPSTGLENVKLSSLIDTPATSNNSPKQRSSKLSALHRRLSDIKHQYHYSKPVLKTKTQQDENIEMCTLLEKVKMDTLLLLKRNQPSISPRFDGVLLYLFERIEQRSNSEGVKDVVINLADMFDKYDRAVPGLADALCEEMYYKIRQEINAAKAEC